MAAWAKSESRSGLGDPRDAGSIPAAASTAAAASEPEAEASPSYTDPRPIGRIEAIEGAETQTYMIRWTCDQIDKLLKRGRKDDKALHQACMSLWALHLGPLAAHRMLADYVTGTPVDQRPTDEQYAEMRLESEARRKGRGKGRKSIR